MSHDGPALPEHSSAPQSERSLMLSSETGLAPAITPASEPSYLSRLRKYASDETREYLLRDLAIEALAAMLYGLLIGGLTLSAAAHGLIAFAILFVVVYVVHFGHAFGALDKQGREALATADAKHQKLLAEKQAVVGVTAEPNIERRSVEIVPACRDEQGFIIETDESSATLWAIVVPYRNERYSRPVGRRVGDINGVVGEVSYIGYNEKYFALDRAIAVWLSENRERLAFVRDASPHRLIVATIEGTNKEKIYAVQRHGSTLGKSVRETLLVGDLFRVRISLFAESETKAVTKSDFMLERDGQMFWDNPIFAGPHLDSTATWRFGQTTRLILRGHDFWKRDREEGVNREQLDADYAAWQNTVAEFVRRHYGDNEKAKFLFEKVMFGLDIGRHQQPSSFFERVTKQLDFLEHLSKQSGL